MQKGFIGIYLLIGIIVLAAIGGAYYFGKLPIKPINSPKACTQEAKQCSDGSYVSREGPNCEFKSCPTSLPTPSSDETANWKTYTNNYFTFKYPTNWNIYTSNKQGDPNVPIVRVAGYGDGASSIVGFSVYDLSNDPWWSRVKFTSDQYLNHIERDPYKDVSDYQSMKVDGNEATEALILPKGGNGISTVEFFVPHGDKGYVLVYELQSPGNGRIIFLKASNPDILSTFKFLP